VTANGVVIQGTAGADAPDQQQQQQQQQSHPGSAPEKRRRLSKGHV
jgi:hypothetical protein